MIDSDMFGSASLPLQTLVQHLFKDGMRHTDLEQRTYLELLQRTIQDMQGAHFGEWKMALHAINNIINLSLLKISIEEKLQKALEYLLSIPSVQSMKQGCLFLVDQDARTLHMVAKSNFSEELSSLCKETAFGECLCGRAMEHDQPFLFKSSIDEEHHRRTPDMKPHGHTLFQVKEMGTGRPLMLVNLYVEDQCREDPRTHFLLESLSMALSVLHALHMTQERLQAYAFTDPTTGIANLSIFQDRANQAMLKAARNQEAFMVVALGVDRFSRINDSLGRMAGDQVLKVLANRFKDHMRASDTVAKADGDEFLFLLSLQNTRDIMVPVQRIQNLVSEAIVLDEKEIRVNVSMGISIFPDDQEQLLEKAKFALKTAKEKGGGEFQIFSKKAHEKAQSMLNLERDLRTAVARKELLPYYQPQISLATMQIIGFEALMRWPDPTKPGGMKAYPDMFIPLAEDTGLIVSLGEQVLTQACWDLKKWFDLGYVDLRIAVNLSPRQFSSPTLLNDIVRVLQQTNLPPAHLELEITESQVMRDPVQAKRILEDLKKIGVHISLDDFGTGYSSLSTLHQFPFDRLKIDRSFVMNLPLKASNANIINTIIQMARGLELSVTAEGVESEDQQTQLKTGGCDDVQGWLHSKAVPAEEVPALLAKYNRGSN